MQEIVRKIKKTLLICYLPSEYSVSKREFKKLVQTLPRNTAIVACDIHGENLLSNLGIQYRTGRSYFEGTEDIVMKEIFKELDNSWNKFTSKLAGKKCSEWDKNTAYFLDAISELCHTEISRLVYLLKLFKLVLKVEQPSEIIVVCQSDQGNKMAVKLLYSFGYKQRAVILKNNHLTSIKYIYTKFLSFYAPFGKLFQNKKDKLNFENKTRPCINIKRKGRIFIIGYYLPDQLNQLFSTIIELEKRGWELNFVVSPHFNERLIYLLKQNDLSYTESDNYLTKKSRLEINKITKSVITRIKQLHKKIIKELFSYEGVNLFDIVPKIKDQYFSDSNVEMIFRYKKSIQTLLDREKPEAIIVHDDQIIFGKLAARIAKDNTIPIFAIPSSFGQYYQFLPSYGRLICTKMLVSGEAVKMRFVEEGLDASRIFVSGATRWDSLKKKKISDKKSFCKKWGLNAEKDIFVFTTQGRPWENEILNMLFEVMKKYPDKQLVVKFHPIEKGLRKRLQVLFSGLKNVWVTKEMDFWDLTNNCTFLITQTSLTALEAMLLKKPVIIIDVDIAPYPMFYIKEKAVAVVTSRKELFSAIERILGDSIYRNALVKRGQDFLHKYVLDDDGNSKDRMADLIEITIKKF